MLRVKTLPAFITAFLCSFSFLAIGQKDIEKNKKIDKEEQIIIRKKSGDDTGKTVIVIEGDKITVNGKPMDDFNGKNITIMKMKRPGMIREEGGGARVFSFPGENMNDLAPELAANKALLGVTTEKVEKGVKINRITDKSGAENAGLKTDDIITKVGDKTIESPQDLVEAIGEHKPNDKVGITYLRDGKTNKTTATLGENKSRAFSFNMGDNNYNFQMPEMPRAPRLDGSMFSWNRKPKIGLQIQDLEEGKGVKVNDVDEDSPAAKSGFKVGDVITGINGKQIEGVDDLTSELKTLKEGDTLKMDYKRNGSAQSAQIKIPKKLKTADL